MMKKVFLFCIICWILSCAPMAEQGSFPNSSSHIQSQVAPPPPPSSQPSSQPNPSSPDPKDKNPANNDEDEEPEEEFESGSETEEVGDPPITQSL